MTEIVSVEGDGSLTARSSFERCILGGGVAVFPADGVYGLACDPTRADAIARIHELKGRDDGKPSAVMYFSPLALRELLGSLGERTRAAIGLLLPGPVTLVVDNPEHRYPLACRDDPRRLGIRLIEGPLAGARCAVFQTSANRSGEAPTAEFETLDASIVAGAGLAVDGGELAGAPSTVVDIAGIEEGEQPRVLREGALDRAEVKSLLASLWSQGR